PALLLHIRPFPTRRSSDLPNGTYYLKVRGYSIEDFARIVSEVTGMDMTGWFAKYVHGVDLLPYDEALAGVGLRLARIPASEPYTDRKSTRLNSSHVAISYA